MLLITTRFYFLVVLKLARSNGNDIRVIYNVLLLLEVARLLVNPFIFFKLYRPIRVQVRRFTSIMRCSRREGEGEGAPPPPKPNDGLIEGETITA